ncbi:MAG: YebC/PmpR family DNA-binding transcriptional regulator [bacterium]|nr:YebC/PmpR family DNA-binding transcriptional regulator [bacterium]
MSGHSKWSTIKHKKAKTDAQRGKLFSKLVREIMMAAKSGDPDPVTNTRLRLAVQKAKAANMPNDNIKRAVQKGAGNSDGVNYDEVTFEAYAPNGVALLIETLTDNRNRTVPNIKSILNKAGGSMASKGSVSYLFEKKGVLVFESGLSEERIMDIATQAGADDIDVKDDGSIEVITSPVEYEQVKNSFDDNGISYVDASLSMIPRVLVSLTSEQAERVLKLIDKLEDDDDIQNVYGNFDVPDDVLQNF